MGWIAALRIAPGMWGRGWGRMVFVSSVAGFTGGVVGLHYSATKAALSGFMHALAGSLAPRGATINAVAPAFIEGGATLPGDEDLRRQLASSVPLGRLGNTREVASTVQALVENRFVTAQTLSVNGGMYSASGLRWSASQTLGPYRPTSMA